MDGNDVEMLCSRIEDMCEGWQRPVVGMEFSHIRLPFTKENKEWCGGNAVFCESLVGRVVKRNGKRIRFLACILVNNLDNSGLPEIGGILDGMKFLAMERVRIIYERTMKNRSYAEIKKRVEDMDRLYDAVGNTYGCRPFVYDNGRRVPRCGLIIYSFISRLKGLASKRFGMDGFLFLSFSEYEWEFRRVMLGIESYATLSGDKAFGAIAVHWNGGIREIAEWKDGWL